MEAAANIYWPCPPLEGGRKYAPYHHTTWAPASQDPDVLYKRRIASGVIMAGMAVGTIAGGAGVGMAVGRVGESAATYLSLLSEMA